MRGKVFEKKETTGVPQVNGLPHSWKGALFLYASFHSHTLCRSDVCEIAIVIVGAKNKRGYLQALEKHPLPKGHYFSDIEQRSDSSVLVSIVNKFVLVIIWKNLLIF
ncbi:hypothetical protein [Paenibacillus contaminans]|uniref:hypothetical protein n=1 Tax=Paenibacillus contaminans TaxID=450362 RepID=UPI0011BFBB0B|nr:hypothetical protein [Paenibacillus contaminans]